MVSKKEIIAMAKTKETYSESCSNHFFNVYKVQIDFVGYCSEFAFRACPKDKNGQEIDVEYWFANYTRLIKFVGLYKYFHTKNFWLRQQHQHYSKEDVMYWRWVFKVRKLMF